MPCFERYYGFRWWKRCRVFTDKPAWLLILVPAARRSKLHLTRVKNTIHLARSKGAFKHDVD